MYCSVLQGVAVPHRGGRFDQYRTHTATHGNTRHHTAIHCNTRQRTATHGNALQYTATHCSTLQHTGTHTLRGNRIFNTVWSCAYVFDLDVCTFRFHIYRDALPPVCTVQLHCALESNNAWHIDDVDLYTRRVHVFGEARLPVLQTVAVCVSVA